MSTEPVHTREGPLDELQLERLALGELTSTQEAALRQRCVAVGMDLDARIAELRSSNEQILAGHPPSRAAAVIERRLGERRAQRRSSWWTIGSIGSAVVATAVVLLIIRSQGDGLGELDGIGGREGPAEIQGGASDSASLGDSAGVVRLKGAQSRLVIHRQAEGSDDGAELLREGQAVFAGDVLQVSYVAAGASLGVIVSIDGRGVTTLHEPSPQTAEGATKLDQGGAIPLTSAYELDDAPAFERFFFVTGEDATLTAEIVMSAARSLARTPYKARGEPLILPAQLDQRSFLLIKKEGRGAGGGGRQ